MPTKFPYAPKTGHCITIGQTESGKTLLNKALAQNYRKHGIKVIVLDPMMDPDWNADQTFDNPERFLAYVKNPDKCLQSAIFIDEAGTTVGRHIAAFEWLTTQSRHHGHVCHLMTQRAEMVNKTMRSQCSTLFAFNVCIDDAKNYAKDFNCKEVLKAESLPQGHFIQVTRFQPPKYGKMFDAK